MSLHYAAAAAAADYHTAGWPYKAVFTSTTHFCAISAEKMASCNA